MRETAKKSRGSRFGRFDVFDFAERKKPAYGRETWVEDPEEPGLFGNIGPDPEPEQRSLFDTQPVRPVQTSLF